MVFHKVFFADKAKAMLGEQVVHIRFSEECRVFKVYTVSVFAFQHYLHIRNGKN